jgi:hypothetical protein
MRLLNIIIAASLMMVITAVVILRAHPAPQTPTAPLPPPSRTYEATSTSDDQSPKQQPSGQSGWSSYTNERYHYQLNYTGTLGSDAGTPSVDLVYITIDPKAEPLHVCAADNIRQWTSQQLFEEWKRHPPATGSAEFPCADYPSYARLAGSAITIASRAAYQVVSFRGPFETVCSYLATAKTLLAICLPPENPAKTPAWQTHFSVYKQIITSVKVSD